MLENKLKTREKKKRIKIKSIDDFIKALISEGYQIKDHSVEYSDNKLIELLKINKDIIDEIKKQLKNEKVEFVVRNSFEFIEYIELIIGIRKYSNILFEKINHIEKLKIYRTEYDRKPSTQEDVSDIIKIIMDTKERGVIVQNSEIFYKIKEIENEINEKFLYSKDIELLKKIIINNKNTNTKEEYDEKINRKTLIIKIPKEIDFSYIKAKKGSVEYFNHLRNNFPRVKRLICNLHKYITYDKDDNVYILNQSMAIQDSVNIAVVSYGHREFKAISGKFDIEGHCKVVGKKDEVFTAVKVNKLGQVGLGYRRVNDSEKKIIEEIYKEIKSGNIPDEGILMINSKWEPCPSCYYVIGQFLKEFPQVSLKINYSQKYGENKK